MSSTPTNSSSRRPASFYIILGLVLLLVLVVLLLPPIAIVDRIMGMGSPEISAQGGAVITADGASLTIPPGAVSESAWVNLTAADTLPQPLPANLAPISAIYRIEQRGDSPRPAVLSLPLPNSSEAPTNLDLYGYNGQSWQWLPSRQLAGQGLLESQLDTLPQAVVIAQTQAGDVDVSADYAPGISLPNDGLTSVTTPVFVVDRNGQITVTALPAELEDSSLALMPAIRNWQAHSPVDIESMNDVLANPQDRVRHAGAIAALLKNSDYPGIELDYKGIDPALKPEFSAFVTELRRVLPADKLLAVRVDMPRQLSPNAWDGGAYDWQALGQSADIIKAPVLPKPQAYQPGGQMDSLLNWATAQVERSKLHLLLRTGSTELVDGQLRDISNAEAVTRLGQAAALDASQIIIPGQKLNFTLRGGSASTGIQTDEGAYWFAYLDEDNRHHTVYLAGNAAIGPALALIQRYGLGGVSLQNPTNDEAAWEMVQNFQPVPVDNEYSVAWRVQGADGEVITEEALDLSQPDYQWTAPENGGAFEVAAIIAVKNGDEISGGSVAVQVATPSPTPSPTTRPTNTPTPSPTPSPTSTPRPTNTATPQPVAQAAAPAAPAAPAQPTAPPPPAVPAVNVPFSYGIQADPRGNIAGNIGNIQALGFNWVKFQMPWKDVESQQGNYNWGMWDELVNAYSNNGIKILLSIPKAPDWARPFDDDKSVEGPPADQQLYADFVAKVADRYRGRVQAIEVWNEQNLWYEAGGVGRINAATYVDLLQRSYRAIKAINPQMIVVSGAMTPAGNVGQFAVDDVEYLQQMYNAGAKGYFDALGAHPSGYNCPATGDWQTVTDPTAMAFRGPFENRHHSWCFRGTMESYREVMVANGDGNKAIVPTEFGWAVSGKPQPGYEYAADNTPEEQAKWIVEAYQLAKQWGWVGPMFLWNLDYGVTAAGTELANFGILNTPAFGALAGMPK